MGHVCQYRRQAYFLSRLVVGDSMNCFIHYFGETDVKMRMNNLYSICTVRVSINAKSGPMVDCYGNSRPSGSVLENWTVSRINTPVYVLIRIRVARVGC